ncbi:MAG: type II secretion system F family protein [Acidimicrobiales bacterium]
MFPLAPGWAHLASGSALLAVTSPHVVLALAVGAGAALAVVGGLLRLQGRQESLESILALSHGESDVPVESVTEAPGSALGRTTDALGRMAGRLDTKGSLRLALDRAQVPLKPGEYIVISSAVAVILGLLFYVVTSRALIGLAVAVAVGFGAVKLPDIRFNRYRRRIQDQLPDSLALISSSMSAGHTFLRSIQMLCEEADAPISTEFARVVAETVLGGQLIDALERMSGRLDIPDLNWAVQAVRIQQGTGGKLSDVLTTLADFMRARQEVRREVQVLSAEGRISAYVLTALPIFLFLAIQVLSPGYLAPFFHGIGLAVLVGTGVFLGVGMVVIFRMVKIDV